jgi:hypothetical protein
MLRPSAIVAKQREVKHISVDRLHSPTELDGPNRKKMCLKLLNESRQLQISSLSSQSLMKRDFKTISTLNCPDFST